MSNDLIARVVEIDNRVNKILLSGGQEALLHQMSNLMPEVKLILDAKLPESELNELLQKYDGFYQLMKSLERLAYAIENGEITVPK